MSTSRTTPPKPRPPVDALKYEKLALAAFRVCEQNREQFDALVKLIASICRHSANTLADRREQSRLLQLLIDTVEGYKQMNAGDLELFQVIALDAKGVGQCRMSAQYAAELLDDAVCRPRAGVITH
ncbi:hypothetical protein [Paraburkholderia sp. ZP32-5]|uniref:hypothetical protein n=1 Tax=Paraburkholderia sp. ZP32-5 TaxID=2883245 RepID=UPI001F3F7B17|nr:hypothetical protein [Paraburkholderia sp. ZP32-5]